MHERGGRLFLALCVLVLVWIGVYWVWEPGAPKADPVITFDGRPPAGDQPATPAPRPDPQPPSPPITEPGPDPRHRAPPPPAEQGPREAGPVGPAFRDYTVRDGDTFERIAQREFGRQSLWTAIAQANPLKDPTRLRPGEVIRIPLDPSNIQGAPGDEAQPAPATTVTYTVAPGDTLEKIARAYYGSAGFAEFIYHHNRDTLTSKDDLRIGQQLRLPPPEGG